MADVITVEQLDAINLKVTADPRHTTRDTRILFV